VTSQNLKNPPKQHNQIWYESSKNNPWTTPQCEKSKKHSLLAMSPAKKIRQEGNNPRRKTVNKKLVHRISLQR
jgi:hypothetical protein